MFKEKRFIFQDRLGRLELNLPSRNSESENELDQNFENLEETGREITANLSGTPESFTEGETVTYTFPDGETLIGTIQISDTIDTESQSNIYITGEDYDLYLTGQRYSSRPTPTISQRTRIQTPTERTNEGENTNASEDTRYSPQELADLRDMYNNMEEEDRNNAISDLPEAQAIFWRDQLNINQP